MGVSIFPLSENVMKTVHVVAWQHGNNGVDHGDGGGFDWYHKPEQADKAFEEEKKTADELKADDYIAFRFDVEVVATDPDKITEEIDSKLIKLTDLPTTKWYSQSAVYTLRRTWPKA